MVNTRKFVCVCSRGDLQTMWVEVHIGIFLFIMLSAVEQVIAILNINNQICLYCEKLSYFQGECDQARHLILNANKIYTKLNMISTLEERKRDLWMSELRKLVTPAERMGFLRVSNKNDKLSPEEAHQLREERYQNFGWKKSGSITSI